MFGSRARKFLSENQYTAYLPYALGEMFLLVIGILVALQIDNWNDSRKESVLEAQYYCRLYESALQDKIQINQLQTEMAARLTASIGMLAALQEQHPNRDSVAKMMLAAIRLSGSNFKPDTSAFEDIKSSGNLNVLTDTDIKDQISRYYSDVMAIAANHSGNADHITLRFFSHNDVIGAGWLNLEFLKTTLDGSAVDIEYLVNRFPLTETIIDSLITDSLFYIAVNARGSVHLQNISNHITDITQALEPKCDDAI